MHNVIVDTSYLLPLFGIDVKTKIKLEEILEEYGKVYYNPISLIEAKWVMYRIVKRGLISLKEARSDYREGLEALLRDRRFIQTQLTSPEVEDIADELEDMGLKDYFDRLIAATAIVNDFKFLTEDRELIRLLKDSNFKHVI